MKQSLEETYKIAKDMANDPRCEDRLAELQSMNDFRLSIIHLLSEYPDFIRNVRSTNKIETKPYEEKYWWKDNAHEGPKRKMRNREITVIPWKKAEPTKLHFHCSIPGHNSVRLKEIPGKGWWCPFRLAGQPFLKLALY